MPNDSIRLGIQLNYPRQDYNYSDDNQALNDIRSISKMAFGSGFMEGTSGGNGYIGILDGRVVKFNTHGKERNDIKETNKRTILLVGHNATNDDKIKASKLLQSMCQACSEMRTKLVNLAKRTGIIEGNEDFKKLLEKCGFKGDEVTKYNSDKSLLSRKIVAKVLNKINKGGNDAFRNKVWIDSNSISDADPNGRIINKSEIESANEMRFRTVESSVHNLKTNQIVKLSNLLVGDHVPENELKELVFNLGNSHNKAQSLDDVFYNDILNDAMGNAGFYKNTKVVNYNNKIHKLINKYSEKDLDKGTLTFTKDKLQAFIGELKECKKDLDILGQIRSKFGIQLKDIANNGGSTGSCLIHSFWHLLEKNNITKSEKRTINTPADFRKDFVEWVNEQFAETQLESSLDYLQETKKSNVKVCGNLLEDVLGLYRKEMGQNTDEYIAEACLSYTKNNIENFKNAGAFSIGDAMFFSQKYKRPVEVYEASFDKSEKMQIRKYNFDLDLSTAKISGERIKDDEGNVVKDKEYQCDKFTGEPLKVLLYNGHFEALEEAEEDVK